MSIKFNPSLLSIALLGAYSCVSFAQTNASSELPTVVVTASRLPQTLSDTIANTTLITRSDIERSGAVDLPGLLSGQASIEFGRSGATGQNASVFMRGTDSTHTLILLDGVPLNSQIGGAAQLELIALDAIERIEIVRGNVSAQYGSRAVGGVIQLFSKANGTAASKSASLEIGTQGQKKISTNLNLESDAVRYGLNASRTRYSGVSAVNTSQSVANPDDDGYGQTLLSAYINKAFTPNFKAGVSVTNTDMKVAYDNDSAPNPTADVQSLDKASTLLQLFTEWKISPNFKNTVKLNQTQEKAIGSNNGVYESTSKDKQVQLSIQNEYASQSIGDFYAGLEQLNNKIIYEYLSPYGNSNVNENRRTLAALAGWQGKASAFGWNLNVRRERADKESINTYFVGLSYDITPAFSVKGSQSTAFIKPTIAERFGYGYNSYNANLLSGEALNQELAVQWAEKNSLIRLGFFKQKSTNQIVFDPSTNLFSNVKEARNHGFELTSETKAPWSQGKIKLALTNQNPVNAVTDKALARRAKSIAGVTLNGGTGAWSWSTGLQFQGNRSDNFFDPVTYAITPKILKSYAKLDASLAYTINPQASVGLYLSNIGKANDQTAYSYSGTPRGAVLRLNYKM